MKKYKVTNMEFRIDREDVAEEFDEDDFALTSDYYNAIDERIAQIEEELPIETVVYLEDDADPECDAGGIFDAVTDKFGWLVSSFDYVLIT